MSFADLKAAARAYAKVDSSVVSQTAGGDESKAVENAGRTYSVDRPRKLTAALTSTGAWEYSLSTLVSGWSGDHLVSQVSGPGGQQYSAPLDSNDWSVYQHADGSWYLRFACSPASGDIFWVEYSAPHTLTEDPDVDTISSDYPNDVSAVAHLAASFILDMAANKYAEQFDATIAADAVARPVSPSYTTLAKEQRDQYEEHMGKKPKVSSARVDWDSSNVGGSDRIFHRRRWF